MEKEKKVTVRRHATGRKLAQKALDLFLRQGYDGTTIDDIARAAGISRRSFFSYFGSKEEVLLASHMDHFTNALVAAFELHKPTKTPFELIKTVLPSLVESFDSEEIVKIDQLMNSTETLRSRKQAGYIRMEDRLFTAFCTHWPEAEQQSPLRLMAMLAIGTMRISTDQWRAEGARRPVASYLRANLKRLEAEI